MNFFSISSQLHAADQLRESIRNHTDLIVVTGEAGTGKTLLMHRLLDTVATDFLPIFFDYAPGSVDEFFDFMLERLYISNCTSRTWQSPQGKMRRLQQYFRKQQRRGQRNAVFIDDAQNLSEPLLVSMLMLMRPKERQKPLLQLTLIGLPRLTLMLQKSKVQERLPQSQTYIRFHPLTREEAADFIALKHQGRDRFSREAIARIITYSRGIPRLISVLFESASFAARSDNLKVVTEEIVDEAAHSCELALKFDAEQSVPGVLSENTIGEKGSPKLSIGSQISRTRPVFINSSHEQEQPMYRTENINKVLKTLQTGSPDVEAAALISEDGLMIASALPQDLDETRVAGMSATLLSLGTRAAAELKRGDVQEVVVRGVQGYSVLVNAGRGVLLLVVANENAKLGLIFFDMREAANALRQIL